MRDRDLYAKILDIRSPWTVADVDLDLPGKEVVVRVDMVEGTPLVCPTCGKEGTRYDSRKRRWRHLDTCQYRTILECDVPRVECGEHGVLVAKVPWAEPGSRFTALFEALVIDWLKETSISGVTRMLGLTWHEVDGVMKRAVGRGLKRREQVAATRIGVDETSFQKRHEYVTVVSDAEKRCVLHVADDRKASSLDGYYDQLSPDQLTAIEVVTMDLCGAYIASTKRHVPEADRKIAFDRFHVAGLLTKAVDEVRRIEHRALMEQGDPTLKGTRYAFLSSPSNLRSVLATALEVLKTMALKTARAWAIKELASKLWGYVSRGWARRAWERWIAWAVRSRLAPVVKAARTIRHYLWGILNAIAMKANNAGAESINAKIQKIKRMACGFRNRRRFRDAIYFHLGGLDLYPALCGATHTKA